MKYKTYSRLLMLLSSLFLIIGCNSNKASKANKAQAIHLSESSFGTIQAKYTPNMPVKLFGAVKSTDKFTLVASDLEGSLGSKKILITSDKQGVQPKPLTVGQPTDLTALLTLQPLPPRDTDDIKITTLTICVVNYNVNNCNGAAITSTIKATLTPPEVEKLIVADESHATPNKLILYCMNASESPNDDQIYFMFLTKAISLDPEKFNLYLSRANIEDQLGEYEAAKADYTKVIELDPNNALSYNDRAGIEISQGEYKAAKSDYTKAISLELNTANSYSGRAIAENHLQEYESAKADYTKAIKLYPAFIYAYKGPENIADQLGEYYAYKGRANIEDQLNENEAAKADYTKAIELNPSDYDAYRERANIENQLSEYEAAQKDRNIETAIMNRNFDISTFPNHATYYEVSTIYEMIVGDYAAAKADSTKAIELYPNNAKYYSFRGTAEYNSSEYEAAEADYTKAIELDPNNIIYYYPLTSIEEKLQKYEAAKANYTKVIKLDPSDTSNYESLANIEYSLDEYEAAKANYIKALELEPSDLETYKDMSKAGNHLGETGAAAEDRAIKAKIEQARTDINAIKQAW